MGIDIGIAPDYRPGRFFDGSRITFPLLSHIVNNLRPEGYAVEFGVAEGTSLAIIAEHMPVVGFDSFRGLPEDWCGYPKGSRACDAPVVEGARIVVGLFADTLPVFDFAAIDPIGLVHFDADLYSSTATALNHIGPHLMVGTVLCFDEWRGYAGVEQHEQRAWREFVDRTGVDWTVIGCDTDAWAIELTTVPSNERIT